MFSDDAAAIYSNVVSGGLAIDNIHILLERGNGSAAIDTVVAYAGQDSLIIELVVEVSGSSEVLNAQIEMRDGTMVLFSGEQSLVAVAGTTPSQPPEIPVVFEGPGAAVVAIDLAPADSAITVADSIVFRPTAKNKDSVNVTDFAVLWSVKDPTRGSISESGVFKPLPGRGSTYVIAKTFTGVKDSARVSITPLATKIVVVSGNNQSGTVGGELPNPVVVESQAADNLPVPNVPVTLIGPPGTVVIQTITKTDANGRINLFVPVGTIAGPIAFLATSAGLAALPLSGTAIAGVAAKLGLAVQPSPTATSGTILATQPKVQVQDQYGNAVASAGRQVTASLGAGSLQSLVGTPTIATDAAGLVTYSGLAIAGPPGNAALTFASPALTSAVSSPITVAVGPPANLALEGGANVNLSAGSSNPAASAWLVTDAGGNGIPGTSVRLVAVTGQLTLYDTTLVTDSTGRVRFNRVTAIASAGVYTITGSSGSLTGSPATMTLTVAAGAADRIRFIASPAGGTGGVAFGFQVDVADAHNNRVVTGPASTSSITVAIKAGTGAAGAVLGPNAAALTVAAVAGVATFSANIDKAATGYKLTAAATGLTGAESNAFAIAVGPAAQITTVAGDSSGVLKGGLVIPVVKVRDAGANNVVGATVTFTPAPGSGTATGSPSTLTTNASGQASANWNVGTSGEQSLTAAVAGLSVTIRAFLAETLVVVTPPPANPQSGLALQPQPKVQLRDKTGRHVKLAGVNVTVGTCCRTDGVDANAVVLSGQTTTATDGNGESQFSDVTLTGLNGVNTKLTFAATGIDSAYSATVAVTQLIGPPASLAASSPIAFADSIQASVSSTNLAAVVVKDAQNVVVPDVPVTFKLYGGQGSLINGVVGPVTVNTGADGIAKLTSWNLRDSIAIDSIVIKTAGVNDSVKILAGVLNGAPHHLAVLGQPSDVDAGQPISVTVVLQDRLNNLASVFTGSSPQVTLAIKSGSGAVGAVLSPGPGPTALTQPASAGVAFFLASIDLPSAGYMLTAAASGFATVETNAFDVTTPPPAPVEWINGAGGNWSVASNWSTGIVPTSDDIVFIHLDGTYTVTLDVNATVKALDLGGSSGNITLSASSKTLTLGDESFVGAFSTLSLTNSTVNGAGTLTVGGTLLAHGTSAINLQFYVDGGGMLRVQGQAAGSNATLTVATGFTNDGTIELTSAGGGYSSTLAVTSGTLTNGGDIDAVVGAGGSRTIAAQLNNLGAINPNQTLTINKPDADHYNGGLIDIVTGNVIVTLTGSTPTFTNGGNISISASRDISISGGESNFLGGTVTGTATSTFIVSNSTLSFSTATINVPISFAGTSPIVGGAVTIPSGHALKIRSGTLDATVDIQSGGTVYAFGVSTITTVTNNGSLKVWGQAFGSNASLTVTNGFTSNGLIELSSQDGGYNSTLTISTGTLVNSATGTISSLAGAGGSRALNARLHNQGLLDVDQALTINRASAIHVNTGSIDLTAANLTITQSGITPNFTNTGSVTLGAGRTFTVSGGDVVLGGGTVSGTPTSTLVVNSSILEFNPSSVSVPMTLTGVTIAAGSVLIEDAELVTLLGGSLTDPVTIGDGGTLRTLGSVALTTLAMEANSVLQVKGQANGGHSTLTIANGFTSFGTIELTSADGGYNAALNVTSGTLTNDAQGFIRSMVGAGGSRAIGAQLNNQGSFDVVQALTLSKASAAHENSGTIYQTSAALTVTQSGGGASFTNTGTISLGANKDFTLSGGTVDMSAGTVSGTATSRLFVTSSTLAFSTTAVSVPMTLVSTGISGGSVTIASGQTLTLVNGGLSDPVTIQGGGTLLTHGAVSLTGALTTTATSTVRVRGQAFGGHATLTVDNGFTNSGTIDLTSQDGGYSSSLLVTNGTLINAAGATIHTIVGAGGSRTIGAQLDNAGTLDVDSDLTLNRASSVYVNSGAIDLTVADLTLTQGGEGPTFTNTGTVTLANSRTWTVNGSGSLDLSSGTVSGTVLSRLIVTGQTLAFNTTTVTIPLTLTTTTIAGGSVSIPTGQTLTLLNGGLSDPVTINSGGTLLVHGAVALNGALTLPTGGTLRLRGQGQGGHTTLTVANGFTNNGLIDLTSQDGGYSSTLAVTSGTLTNASGATIHSIVGAGGSRTLSAQLDNQGTLDVDADLTLNKADADHTNGGAIDLANADLTLTQSGSTPTFSQSAAGTVTLGANRTWTVGPGGAVDVANGSVSGPVSARFVASGTALAFTPSTVTIPMTLTTTTISGGSVTVGTSQTLTLLNGGLSNPVTINSGGTLLIHGVVSLTDTVIQSGNLRVRGQGTGGHATLTLAKGLLNDGLVELTSADGGYSSTLAVTTGTLKNNSGAMVHSDVGAGGARTIAADVRNYGTLDVDQALTLNKADAAHYNYNFIDLSNADLTVTQTGTSPSFGNGISANITLGANRDLVVTGGTANFIGSSLVQGAVSSRLVMTGGTLNFTPNRMTVPMTLTSVTIQGGTVSIPNGYTVTLQGGTLAAAVTVQSGGMLLAHGSAATNSVTVDLGGTLKVQGQPSGGHATLTVDNGVTNNGEIRLTSVDGGYNSQLALTNSYLANNSTGTIVSDPGAGGGRTIAAEVANIGGTLEVDQALTLNKPGAQHTNTGIIDLTAANMTVTQTGTSPTFTNNGTIQLATSRTLTVSGGVFTNATGDPSGAIQGPGTLVVSTTSFTNHGNMSPATGFLTVTGDYAQNVTNGTANFDLSSNVLGSGYGQIAISGSATLSGTLNVSLNDFLPTLGQEFTIMTFASRTGTFSTENLPDLTSFSLQWQVQYNATNVKLKLLAFP